MENNINENINVQPQEQNSNNDSNSASLPNNEFKVSLSSIDYEGPLSILFDMLKRSEKNIYEVSILEIIDQFIEYLKEQAALNLDSTGEFLVVASDFHLYKSKMLLPHDMDDDKFTDRLKFEIVEQMLEFQRYKMVSEELDRLQEYSDSIFERKDTERVKFFQNNSSNKDNEMAWKDVTLYDLVYAFTKVQFVPETDLAVLSGMSNFHIDNAIDMIRIKLAEEDVFPFIVLFKDGVTAVSWFKLSAIASTVNFFSQTPVPKIKPFLLTRKSLLSPFLVVASLMRLSNVFSTVLLEYFFSKSSGKSSFRFLVSSLPYINTEKVMKNNSAKNLIIFLYL